MSNAHYSALALICIAVLSACSKSDVSPAAREKSRATTVKKVEPTDRSPDPSGYETRQIRLAEEIVDPDADQPLVADEDTADEDPQEAVVLNEMQAEVAFQPASTTSLKVTAAQGSLVQSTARHNRETRHRAAIPAATEQPPPATLVDAERPVTDANNASTSLTPAAPVDKPAPPLVVDEEKILADPHGQWAATASASSTYAQTPGLKADYSPWQATGAPNVPTYSDSTLSWTTRSGDSAAPEWLELGFSKPVHATAIRIRQNAAPGAVSKIELIDSNGALHEIWSGTDDTPYEKNTIGWLIKEFPRTDFVVKGARITLITGRVWGWNEIDAVQLVGQP